MLMRYKKIPPQAKLKWPNIIYLSAHSLDEKFFKCPCFSISCCNFYDLCFMVMNENMLMLKCESNNICHKVFLCDMLKPTDQNIFCHHSNAQWKNNV